jgi:hypothetical protein
MTGQKPKAQKPKIRKSNAPSDKDAPALERAAALISKDPTLSKRAALRQAGIEEARKLRQLAGKLSTPARKVKAEPPPRKAPARASSRAHARAQAAAPLLARAPKKIGTVEKAAAADKPSERASYQPKTEPPASPVNASASTVVPPAAFDMMALARPWMTLGWRMTATGLAMQASMAKAALELPPAATAMRQSAQAFNAWLDLVQPRKPNPPKD